MAATLQHLKGNVHEQGEREQDHSECEREAEVSL
jgi:hypothetical protein